MRDTREHEGLDVRLGDDTVVVEGTRVVPMECDMSLPAGALLNVIGSVTDWTLSDGEDTEIEVLWDHLDSKSWWYAKDLRTASAEEIEALS